MNRSAFQVMRKLIVLIKPLLHIMAVAIILGVCGHLTAILITTLGVEALVYLAGYRTLLNFHTCMILMIACAILRGIFRYIEQASNHYIAFKILAIIRHKVFMKLRTLAPAKLDGKDKGNLISIITSDIELLEVFYAHTISPIVIAFITSFIMIYFIARYHYLLAVIALCSYIIIGIILPIVYSHIGKEISLNYRNAYGDMNGFVLDSLRGIKESMQYHHDIQRLNELNNKTKDLEAKQYQLKRIEASNTALSDLLILLLDSIMVFTSLYLYHYRMITFPSMMICMIAFMSSFGPVLALSNLSNNLQHTIASGNRVLDLLEEQPIVQEVTDRNKYSTGDINVDHVSFSYDNEKVLDDIDLLIKNKENVGIYGKSGSGKSTLLKLLMHFYDCDQGDIMINHQSIKDINSDSLRTHQAYVSQTTYLFNDTIINNITLGKDYTLDQVIEACKKASIHDFIMSLEHQYETHTGELGSKLSTGQIQRIGLARAFLHDSDMILLDEPTSNLDTLNEAIILKSLKEEGKEKTIVLVSHRKSTMSIVDKLYHINSSRIS